MPNTRKIEYNITEEVAYNLSEYAKKYETIDFIINDPSWFMHQVKGVNNQETIAFIAACLSYGTRKIFMKKIQFILDCCNKNPYNWIKYGLFRKDIPNDAECFYRLYKNKTMFQLFETYQEVIKNYNSLGEYIKSYCKYSKTTDLINSFKAIEAICFYFNQNKISGIVPINTKSSCKRICMFLRWMVRDNSPVDLGIWSSFIDKSTLIIPLDTHVISQSYALGLISSKYPTMTNAQKLTNTVKKIFANDPLKADFALFGYGVNKNRKEP